MSDAEEAPRTDRREHQRRGRLLAVGVIMIAAGIGVLVLSVRKGWGAGFVVVPSLVLVVFGALFVLISANVDHVDVNVGERRAGLHVGSSAAPTVRTAAASPIAAPKQRRPRQCRLVKRNRAGRSQVDQAEAVEALLPVDGEAGHRRQDG